MTWFEIGKNHLQAAQRTLDHEARSAASRAYYAAHVVLADVLAAAGYALTPGRQTPPHNEQPQLIGQHLAARGLAWELRAVIRRLYARRIDADYKRTVTVDRATAVDSIRDASTLFRLMNVS
jgi:uncharacterized protein (UPF0332 family)